MTARVESLELRRRAAPVQRLGLSHWLLWGVVAMFAVLGTVLAELPASWLTRQLAQASAGRVLLGDPQGTLWQGSASLILTAGGDTRLALPGRLAWSVAVWPLFMGGLQVTLCHRQAFDQPIVATARHSGWTLASGAMNLPPSLLDGLGTPFNTLHLDGRLRASWSTLSGHYQGSGWPQGTVTIQLDDIASGLTPLRPLGSYRVALRLPGAEGSDIPLTLTTLRGPLTLEGVGRLGEHGYFQGHASATADTASSLIGLLHLLGPPEGTGYQLRF